jgi:hypothetical protein
MSNMESSASGPAKSTSSKLIPTPEEVRTWPRSRLLDYLDSVFASFEDDRIRTAFRSALINGTSFLELFGNPAIYADIGIPKIPGWCLAKEANDILGNPTPALLFKRTYTLRRR